MTNAIVLEERRKAEQAEKEGRLEDARIWRERADMREFYLEIRQQELDRVDRILGK